MYQRETYLTNLVSVPSTNAAMSPENSSSSSYMNSNLSAPGNSSVHSIAFPSPVSTDHLQQLHNIPDSWLNPSQISSMPHHQNSWEPLTNQPYFPQPTRQSPTSRLSKPRRNHLYLGYKRSGSSRGKSGLRGLREDAEDNCGVLSNDSVSPGGDPVSMIDGINGSAASTAVATKRCRVCGDRAVNHNFGQLTCESCKAFFRRNAHKDLTCTSKSGEHVVSPSTRRECPACRLKRCFLIGMRPDLIQVRKKDGTKPRWLDKYPAAAQVHEHVTRTDVPKLSRSPGDARSNRDSYSLSYPLYTEASHPMLKSGRSFESYPTDPNYAMATSHHAPNNSEGIYEENGQSITGMLTGDVMDNLSSPQYRMTDESARFKSLPWIQGQSTSNSSWSQGSAPIYQAGTSAPAFQTGDAFLFEGFPADPHCQHHPSSHYHQASLLANMQITQERPNFAPAPCLDTYVNSIHPSNAESRSGTSSGSTTSSSVLTNFGSGGSDSTIQGNFDLGSLKAVTSEWTPLTEGGSGSVYLQNLSPLRSQICVSVKTEQRQPLISPTEGEQLFQRLSMAWKFAWREGIFPNPSNLRLHLDLDSLSPEESEDWRLTLSNLWSDLLLRRVADFASSLFLTSQTDPFSDLRVSPSLLSWIFRHRLVNGVPVILARALLRSTEMNCSSSSQNENLDGGGSSPRSPRDLESTLLHSNGSRKSTLSVAFQVAPNNHVYINLSRLNAKLVEGHTKTAYPMLQYLDAYISELNKFLTDQTLLLGAFMAIKLTEPPTQEELLQNPLSDVDLQQIHTFHTKFAYLFGVAADHVASIIVKTEPGESTQTRAKAMNDADSRRNKLPDFLSWGCQFDKNMKSLLYDVWNASRQQSQIFISPGLAALFSESGQLNQILSATDPREYQENV
ncbi:unnamed protein product [Hymenolepis diminuta]|uniref:Nuclear receptor domain-containing protein n=1 Tax=Hymenolepis diminuta TaxID=6216 RepID=A0A564Y198_HYMDI|nr:unnamed protein product [Hymenolepis diminuta]